MFSVKEKIRDKCVELMYSMKKMKYLLNEAGIKAQVEIKQSVISIER